MERPMSAIVLTAALAGQWRSNQVSGPSLLKTGIFLKTAGDFWRFDWPKRPNGKVETKCKCVKARCLRPLPGFGEGLRGSADCLAGAGGIEPPNGGIKIRCLTAWLRPNWPGGNGATLLSQIPGLTARL